MMRVDGAWKPSEAVRDPRGPIWPSATSAVREDLEVLWDDVLLKTNEHMRQKWR